jgi:hypothetical protein
MDSREPTKLLVQMFEEKGSLGETAGRCGRHDDR